MSVNLNPRFSNASSIRIPVDAPGAYELSSHDRHESHRLSLTASPGIAVYAVAFAAGLPPEA